MRLDELQTLIASSRPAEWRRIKLSGPTYRDRFGAWSSPADGTSGIDHCARGSCHGSARRPGVVERSLICGAVMASRLRWPSDPRRRPG